jgi:anti-sigma factor RsiW
MKESEEIRLSKYLDRELDPAESREVADRLKADPEADHVLKEWEEIGGILRDSVADVPAPDPGQTWHQIKMEITGQHPSVPRPAAPPGAPRPRMRWVPGLLALLASLALAAAALYFL